VVVAVVVGIPKGLYYRGVPAGLSDSKWEKPKGGREKEQQLHKPK